MGRDSVQPFLEFEDKWVFLLALTSNPGANDFQYSRDGEQLLYQKVLQTAPGWAEGSGGHLGFVVGATRAEAMQEVRRLAPRAWLLVPGIGAQGGDLKTVLKHGLTPEGGLLINSSRGIIYAGQDRDFAQAAGAAARDLQQQMAPFIQG
jgi:orotidine-5'-phosphate decarboxylase